MGCKYELRWVAIALICADTNALATRGQEKVRIAIYVNQAALRFFGGNPDNART